MGSSLVLMTQVMVSVCNQTLRKNVGLHCNLYCIPVMQRFPLFKGYFIILCITIYLDSQKQSVIKRFSLLAINALQALYMF